MRMAFQLSGVTMLVLAFILPALAQEEKKSEKKEKLIKVGEITGKVAAVDEANKSFTLQVGRQHVTWATHDDVKVRTQNPPIEYDDKGKKKRYSAKELKELKGKGNLPGYTASFGDLKANQIVQVTLHKRKAEDKPFATMILIMDATR